MSNTFFISDTHFGHANTFLKFKKPDGSPLRPFESVEHMDETMVARWNEVVRPDDLVYHLGDVVMHEMHLHRVMPRLNGKKRLIMGNHDHFGVDVFKQYFEDLMPYYMMYDAGLLLSHVPLYSGVFAGKVRYNVHGHLHGDRVMRDGEVDDRYVNVSVEQLDYTPISLEQLMSKL